MIRLHILRDLSKININISKGWYAMFMGPLFVIAKKQKQLKFSQQVRRQQISVHPYNGILFGNKKEKTTDTCDNWVSILPVRYGRTKTKRNTKV